MVNALKISMETTRFWLKEFILSVPIRIGLICPEYSYKGNVGSDHGHATTTVAWQPKVILTTRDRELAVYI